MPVHPQSRLATNVAAVLAKAPGHVVEGAHFKSVYATVVGETLDLKGGKLSHLLARCEAAGVCWLEFRQDDARHPPNLFVHGKEGTATRSEEAAQAGGGGGSSSSSTIATTTTTVAPSLRTADSAVRTCPEQAPTEEMTRTYTVWCCLSGWVQVSVTTGRGPDGRSEVEAEVDVGRVGAACVEALPSEEDDMLPRVKQMEEDEAFARELAAPSASDRLCLSPASEEGGPAPAAASLVPAHTSVPEQGRECAICMDRNRCLDICLWPCRHRHFCRGCAETLVSGPCPICRCTVKEVLALF